MHRQLLLFTSIVVCEVCFGQTEPHNFAGIWRLQKHVVTDDSLRVYSPFSTKNQVWGRQLNLRTNNTYTITYYKNGYNSVGEVVESGMWKAIDTGKAILFYKRIGKNTPPGFKYKDLKTDVVEFKNGILVVKELALSGEEGVFGDSYYVRAKK